MVSHHRRAMRASPHRHVMIRARIRSANLAMAASPATKRERQDRGSRDGNLVSCFRNIMTFYIAAFLIIMGVALYVAAPLSGGLAIRAKKTREELERDHWEHEHALAVQGLRELEFDREMGKLSDLDYESLGASLENRALTAMSAIERFKEQERAANFAAVNVRPKLRAAAAIANEIAAMSQPAVVIPTAPGMSPHSNANEPAPMPRNIASEIAGGRRIRFCPQCGTRAAASGNFCGECGAPLRGERVATRAS